MQLLPGTQGIYGLLIAFLVLLQVGAIGTVNPNIDNWHGWSLIIGALPIGIVGFLSALWQGNMAIAGISMISKRPDSSGKAITMTAMVETYAILALVTSFLIVMLGVQIPA
jgi:V/A-type H+-transporting ATPase subunit K